MYGRILVTALFTAVLGLLGRVGAQPAAAVPPGRPAASATNVILFIGDGMGPAQVAAASYAKGGQQLVDGKPPKLFFETFPVHGTATTFAADSFVTDSAASATSLASGVKTYNGAIGLDVDKQPVETLAEIAHARGMATAVVSSVGLNHATPAAFYAHVEERGMYDEILDQYFAGSVPDVLFGGGIYGQRWDLESANKASTERGMAFFSVENLGTLDPKALKAGRVFGSFDTNNNRQLDYIADPDRAPEPELAEITVAALSILVERGGPFFMVVEGGAIDWAGHANDGANVIGEVLAFDKAVEQTAGYLRARGLLNRTLIVVTADHETGGMGLNGPYKATITGEAEMEFGWTTKGHTAMPVPVYALGPGAAELAGKVDHINIHAVLRRALE